jgi:opacity protein-like surface antigen
MKRIIKSLKVTAITTGFFGLLIANGTASASYNNLKFYAGTGLDYAKYSVDKKFLDPGESAKRKGFGLLIPMLGIKFHENFAVEAGYSFNKKISIQEAGFEDVTYKIRNSYLDVVGLIPVRQQFDLIGGLGIGKLMAKIGANPDQYNQEIKNRFGWRAKLGAQYNYNNNIAVRALVTYQHAGNKSKIDGANETKFIKNMKSIGLSAIYTF